MGCDNCEKYNGYSNYYTWLLCLNIDCKESLYDSYRNYRYSAENLKESLEFVCSVDNGFKIDDFWSFREWELIDWDEVLVSRIDDGFIRCASCEELLELNSDDLVNTTCQLCGKEAK